MDHSPSSWAARDAGRPGQSWSPALGRFTLTPAWGNWARNGPASVTRGPGRLRLEAGSRQGGLAIPESRWIEHRPDFDPGCERAVERAFVGDLEQTAALVGAKGADKPQRSLDAVDHRILVFAVCTVLFVCLAMMQAHFHAFKWPALMRSVHLHGHGRAGS
jgi:hypothetical protein